MRVSELIALLEQNDPNAQVILVTQPRWPVESAICGVTTRAAACALDPDDDALTGSRGSDATDVFIVEGKQLRYGNSAAWEACR